MSSRNAAAARSRLPVLDHIRVASPCPASWDAMTGDARVRACGDCKQNVYNLSELTGDEAEALIREREGRLCVRYFQRQDGTILLKDCVIGVRKRRRRGLVALGLVATVARAYAAVHDVTEVKGEMTAEPARRQFPNHTPDGDVRDRGPRR